MAPEYLVLGIGVEEATLERRVASSGHGLATFQWFFPNSAEGLWDMGGLSWQTAGTGPEISGSNLILKQVSSARSHPQPCSPHPHPTAPMVGDPLPGFPGIPHGLCGTFGWTFPNYHPS